MIYIPTKILAFCPSIKRLADFIVDSSQAPTIRYRRPDESDAGEFVCESSDRYVKLALNMAGHIKLLEYCLGVIDGHIAAGVDPNTDVIEVEIGATKRAVFCELNDAIAYILSENSVVRYDKPVPCSVSFLSTQRKATPLSPEPLVSTSTEKEREPKPDHSAVLDQLLRGA